MKFKTAMIEHRFSRESGTGPRGTYEHGVTYTTGYVTNLVQGQPLPLAQNDPLTYAVLEINAHRNDGELDAEIFLNSRFAYRFEINGVVSNQYTTVRFYFDGFWYLLEYRFVARTNS